MRNKKTGSCCWCGLRLEPGQGNLAHVEAGDENLGFGPMGATGWLVSCPDRTACRARVTVARESEDLRREEARRVNNLERELFPADKAFFAGWLPDNQPHNPWGEGDEFVRPGQGRNIYGGGECYILGDSRIWKIRNNGMDGDCWSSNNVRTGGAGAIGYIYPRTEDRVAFLLSQCTNKSVRRRQENDAKAAKKAARLDAIRPALQAMLARGVTLEAVQKNMKPGQHEFCPMELVVGGKPSTTISIHEAREALGLV